MPTLRRFAPLIAIVALLFIVAVGGAALANNNQTPDIDPRTATVSVGDDTGAPETAVGDGPATSEDRPSEQGTGNEGVDDAPAREPAPAPAPQPAPDPAPAPAPQPQYRAPAPAPQPPLNYQYYDDDWDDDDGDDDDWDDDWDD
ncbi:hypothetical protein [Corynebacterium halotolerans]|uniref:Secreted protein n=1 Tax=Corynebacterium halotolerans YIM 70093 = DSM 44683 TaxID=1121362 RepID=M1MZV0_9CORY|nr:hypothetical protein [Corynebacterium halotolerans]AGF73249.1 hypothetical protein A605_11245 [Corynebacterium halotolerans YIM 70093 = DSM 44683]